MSEGDELISKFHEMVDQAEAVVAFTGAGISAESGIPTYRGAGGLWSKYDPDKYANISYFMNDPTYYWNFFKDVRYPVISKAEPNAGHKALVELERSGKLIGVITQNIDGLHQLAGSENVVELHGNTRRIRCMECQKLYGFDEVRELVDASLPPACSCGGGLKPEVVFFGEALPIGAISRADALVNDCDLFISIGSSLVVFPAAQFPMVAKGNGAKLVIVNIDPTPYDGIADIVLHRSASEVLPRLVVGGEE